MRMNEAVLADLLDTHGADPARWPADRRAAALEFVSRSPKGARALEAAERLDRMLTDGLAAEAGADLRFRILATAKPRYAPVASGSRFSALIDRWRIGAATAAAAASMALGMIVGIEASVASVLEDQPQEGFDLAAIALEVDGFEDIR